MHDIDRTQLETADEFEADAFEFQEGGEFEFQGEMEAPFDEVEEMQLASELMEITDEAELDQFLGNLIRRAGQVVGRAVQTPLGRAVGSYLKGAFRSSLPGLSGLYAAAAPVFGRMSDSRAPSGNGAGNGFGYPAAANAGGDERGADEPPMNESAGDQEFELARDLVRMAGSAVSNATNAVSNAASGALQSPQGRTLQNVARSAVQAAASAHMPALLGSVPARARRKSGRWYRQGGQIVIEGL